jgi:hypothetical protein
VRDGKLALAQIAAATSSADQSYLTLGSARSRRFSDPDPAQFESRTEQQEPSSTTGDWYLG